jgi:hypothetical protein
MPVLLERLFIDDARSKPNYLIALPAGIHGSGEELLYLSMKFDDGRKDEDGLENMLCLSVHFSNAFFADTINLL